MQWQSSCQCSFNFNCGTFHEIHHKVPWKVIWWVHFSVVQYNHKVIFLQGEGNDLCYWVLFCWCVNSLRNPTKNNCLMKHIFNLEASILEWITFLEYLSESLKFLSIILASKNILTSICVRLVVDNDLSLLYDSTTTSVILTCCPTETGVEDRSRHKETLHLADWSFRTRALTFTSLPRTRTVLVISDWNSN